MTIRGSNWLLAVAAACLLVLMGIVLAGCGDGPAGQYVVHTEYGFDVITYCDWQHGNRLYIEGDHDAIAAVRDPSCQR